MASTGFTLGTTSTLFQSLSVDWTTPGNVHADDGSDATCVLFGFANSHTYRTSGYGFAIPGTATIDGIIVRMQKDATAAGCRDLGNFSAAAFSHVLVKAGTPEARTTGLGDTATDWSTAGKVNVDYGSSSNLWGGTWTPTDINDANFGFVFGARKPAGGSSTAAIDAIWIDVHYTPAGGSVFVPQMTLLGVG